MGVSGVDICLVVLKVLLVVPSSCLGRESCCMIVAMWLSMSHRIGGNRKR